MPNDPIQIDCLPPPAIARRAEDVGVAKCGLAFMPLLSLGILAGAFIALGAVFSTTVATGAGVLPFGVQRLLIGLAFCVGLILVIAGGAELFTGNNLIVMAWARRRVTTRALLRNWGIVYLGNAIGALGTVALVILAKHHEFGGGEVGHTALRTATAKLQFSFGQAVALGILCNALVCLAVWIAMGARSLAGRIMAIIFPITAFVASGFEHSIANLYFVPYALVLRSTDKSFVERTSVDVSSLEWGTFLTNNLLPVTLGNIIGGALLVAGVYWFVYLRDSDKPSTETESEAS